MSLPQSGTSGFGCWTLSCYYIGHVLCRYVRVYMDRNKATILFDFILIAVIQCEWNCICNVRNMLCGTWYLPHSWVHCDVTIMFLDPDCLYDATVSAIWS